MFFNHFWLGSKDGKTKGYLEILQENGYAIHRSQLDGKGGATNAFSQTIKLLPIQVQRGIVKEFESSTGLKYYYQSINKVSDIVVVFNIDNLPV